MARPIQADAAATRRRILGAASDLFSAKGLAETTTRQIAKASAVSLATVHHYFGGKADLYRACITEMYSGLEALTEELATIAGSSSHASLAELLPIAICRSYAFAREHRSSVRLLMRTVLDSGELDSEWRERYQLPLLDRGTTLLASVVDKPASQLRATFMALEYLVVRFSLNSPEELARVIGNPAASEQECVKFVEDYLVSMALTQLGIQGQ